MTALVIYAIWEVGWIVVDLRLKRQGPLLLTWFNFNPNMDELLLHSQTSTVEPLTFGNGEVISSHTL